MATLKKNDKGEWELECGNCRWTVDNISVNLDHIPPGTCSYTAVTLDELIRIFNKVGIIAPMYCKGRLFTPEKLYINDDRKPVSTSWSQSVINLGNEIEKEKLFIGGHKIDLNTLKHLDNKLYMQSERIESLEKEIKDLKEKHEKHWHSPGCLGGEPQYRGNNGNHNKNK